MKNLLLFTLLALACCHVHAQCGSSNYTEPDFTITVQDPACPLYGEIKVSSVTGGIGPFTYTLLPNNISNTTGVFSNIPVGTYIVQMKDACGTIRSRQATLSPFPFTSSSSYTKQGCGNYTFTINPPASNSRLEYGYSLNGSSPIIWGDSSIIKLRLTPPIRISLYVRDSCGNQSVTHHDVPKEMEAYIKELKERIMCNGQEIYPEYYGFTSPRVCLYKSPQNTLVECKYAPTPDFTGGAETNFFSLPFGQDYYVIVDDGCHRDSAFFKDKTSVGGTELNPFNWKCNTFDIHADGNNYDTVCLWNAATNTLVSCKPWTDTSINPNTGKPWPYGGAEWYDLPYGTYYAFIFDPCLDTLLRIDTTVRYPNNIKTDLFPTCAVSQTGLYSYFSPETPLPWTTNVYWPNDSLVKTQITTCTCNPGWFFDFPTYPQPGTIKIVQTDGCGYTDTSYLVQQPFFPTRSLKVLGGCPGINGTSGGGDIILSGDRKAYAGVDGAPVGTVSIIKKDNQNVNIPQSYTQWNNAVQQQEYYFTNLSTGMYILESTIGCNGYKVYDTINVRPYVYPLQEQTHITQCGINSYVFRDTVTGGVAPFTYEIVGTQPSLGSLLTGPQSSNIFSIPPGTNLNTITIQVIDACGNSNTKAFPVDHLGNCMPLTVDSFEITTSLRNKQIKIFPNPAEKQFTVFFSQKKKSDYKIEIYNVGGAKIHTKYLHGIDSKGIPINEDFKPGVYIINIIDLKTGSQSRFKQVIL